VKFSPREETTRKQTEKQREEQEERIDGSASAPVESEAATDKDAYGLRPHEEELHNDLLVEKEQLIAPIAETAPVFAETEATLGQPAPDDIKAEVQAAIAAASEVTESVKQTVEDATPKPTTEGEAPAEPKA